MTSFLFATLLSTVTVCGFIAASERMMHWFVVPVWCCGIVIGRDAVDWLRGRLDILDPGAIVGVLGVHFFFLAPLLHVAWDYWLLYVEPPPDWRDWLGAMALVNVGGLLMYQAARTTSARGGHAMAHSIWQLDRPRFAWVAGCGLLISAALQVWVYAAHGGILGYVDAFTESIGLPQYQSAFAGMAWIFTVSESFPILAMFLFAACAARTRAARSWAVIIAVLAAYFVLKLLFGGLRGSRANTIWGVFWAVGIIHLWIRPLGKRFVLAGLCVLIAFMYLYGFYKNLGGDVLLAYEAAPSELSQTAARTFEALVLGDLARADVQAFLFYRLWTPAGGDYSYAWGRTYLGTLALLIPRRLWPERSPTKVKEGTEVQYGVGSYDEDEWSASNVYGLAGETMLNFGPLVVPFAYLAFGLIVGRLQAFRSRAHPRDARLVLYPFMLYVCFSILLLDSDNVLFMLIKEVTVPLFVVWCASRVSRWSPVDASLAPTEPCFGPPSRRAASVVPASRVGQ